MATRSRDTLGPRAPMKQSTTVYPDAAAPSRNDNKLKMPQLAPAVRVLVCGTAQTPSIDAVLALFAHDTVLARLLAGANPTL